jgi:Ribbon-helix-helix domain
MPKPRSKANPKPPVRNGVPLTVYFSDHQTARLNEVSEQRRVPKAELLRVAVDLLLDQLASGQLQLPLGIEIGKAQR